MSDIKRTEDGREDRGQRTANSGPDLLSSGLCSLASSEPLSPLNPAQARQIDRVCDRFEAACKAGQRPSVEENLSTVAEPVRSALLRQLLLLDWDYRRRAGEGPHAGNYHTRFPGDTALIDDVGREMTEALDSTRLETDDADAMYTPWSGGGAPDDVPVAGLCEAGTGVTDPGCSRYQLLREVGHGGIGVVFRGRDQLLGRELAIKELREDYRDKPDARRRLIEEARVGSQLQHPAIVPVYEQGWFGDRRPYFTMKLVEGHTLAELLRDRAKPAQDWPRLLTVFEQVCQAMAYAHSKGVVHRDLKPANVMVGAFGEVQVMDWGFAKVITGDGGDDRRGEDRGQRTEDREQRTEDREQRTEDSSGTGLSSVLCPLSSERPVSQSGVLMGTPAYMPPEQARGEATSIDARADVFSLGAILCEILTGRPPYVGGTADEVCRKAADGDLRDAHARLDACGADEALRELARHCLAAERPARPPDAGVVARDLTAYLASAQERLRQAQLERAAAEARVEEARAKVKAERRARRLTLALAAASVVLLALAASGWWWHERVQQALALRVATADSKVEAALAEASDYLNRRDWSRARAAVTRASELCENGTSDHWKPRADEMAADLDMVGQLDEIRLLRVACDRARQRLIGKNALARYADAFAGYGIRTGTDPHEVAARVAKRPASVRDALEGGLDNWWLLAIRDNASVNDWLWAVLQTVPADEWQTRVRRAIVNRDRHLLEGLAVNGDLARQPQSTVTLLTWALLDVDAYDAAITLLRPAQQRYPHDYWINFSLGVALRLRQPPNYAEALRFYSIARALRPETSTHVNLGGLLIKQKDWDGVIAVSRQVIELQPDSAEAYNHLGVGLESKGDWQQAQVAYRKAIELSPELAEAHYNLGLSLQRRGQEDLAISALKRAIGLAPHDAEIRFAMGQAEYSRNDFDAALVAFDQAIELDPSHVLATINRGNALAAKGRVDEALASFERASRLDPTLDIVHSNLGNIWFRKGRLDRAIAAHSRAIELNPKSAANHYNLGTALEAAQDWGGASAANRESIRLDPSFAEAHCNLGSTLQEQSLFAEALASIERGHRLGSARPNWRYPSADWLRHAQRLVDLDASLPGILAESEKPVTIAEQLEYASVCQLKGLYGASARLYASAFTVELAPAKSFTPDQRFRAACVAALAGSGQGRDAVDVDPIERARWRRQALDWLRVDVTLWADQVVSIPQGSSSIQSTLQSWQREKALAGIRDAEKLARLPEPERADCLRFWAQVQELLVRCMAVLPAK